MVAFNGSEPCGSAEEYYHDFVVDDNDPSIPHGVREHIKQCAHCLRRLARLRELLDGVGREPALRSLHEQTVIDHLDAHFRLLGEQVTCAHIKRFLPSLVGAGVRIRIPTPVTVHIDQCPACAADLESLRALELDDEQLARLGHLYADGSAGGLWTCLRVQARLSLGWHGSLEGMEHDVLDHLCVCRRCRRRVYQQRQRRLARELAGLGGGQAVCAGATSSNDIFEVVVPYGNLDPEFEDERLRACGAHLRSCPICLERAQAMYRVVYGILERPNSEVVTVCTACAKDPDDFDESRTLYGGYPIHAEVLNAGEVVPPRRLSRVTARLRPALKPTIMAAAIIPLLAVLVFKHGAGLGLESARDQQDFQRSAERPGPGLRRRHGRVGAGFVDFATGASLHRANAQPSRGIRPRPKGCLRERWRRSPARNADESSRSGGRRAAHGQAARFVVEQPALECGVDQAGDARTRKRVRAVRFGLGGPEQATVPVGGLR